MKARISTVLALIVVALSLAAVASAGPRQSSIRTWSHQAPAGSKTWDANRPAATKTWGFRTLTVRGWTSKNW